MIDWNEMLRIFVYLWLFIGMCGIIIGMVYGIVCFAGYIHGSIQGRRSFKRWIGGNKC